MGYMGDLYPGGGRASTFMHSLPGPYDMMELDSDDKQGPTLSTSNLKTANIYMALVVMVAIVLLAQAA